MLTFFARTYSQTLWCTTSRRCVCIADIERKIWPSVIEAQVLELTIITSVAYDVRDVSLPNITVLCCKVRDAKSLYVWKNIIKTMICVDDMESQDVNEFKKLFL